MREINQMRPHPRYMPNALEEFKEEERANMTEHERKEVMQQELFDQMEAAREAKQQAQQNLHQAQQREQELRQHVRVEHAELQELERATQSGDADSIQAARELPHRTRQLQNNWDELGILQNTTIPSLQKSYEQASLEYELRVGLTGKDGYLTREEANQIIDQATREIQSIITDALQQLQASDQQVDEMTAAVQRAQHQGIIDPRPHDAPIKVTGDSLNYTLSINGETIPDNHELSLKLAMNKVYDQAVNALKN